jgi:hypothetical protein
VARDLKDRFLAKVDRTGACWVWAASKFKSGYGKFRLNGRTRRAHRVAWELFRGVIPEGLLVLHGPCNDRACVNPDHLQLGTYKDNAEHSVQRDRTHRATFRERPELAPRGERHYRAKLSEEDVREILRLRGTGVLQKELASRYGVSQSHISLVGRRRSWAHVEDARG